MQIDTIIYSDTIVVDSNRIILNNKEIQYNTEPVLLHTPEKNDSLAESASSSFKDIFKNELHVQSLGWIPAVLLFLFVLLALIKKYYNRYFVQIMKSIFNHQLAAKLYRDSNQVKNKISMALNFLYLVVVSLFFFEVLLYHDIPFLSLGKHYQLWVLLGIVIGFFLFRFFSLKTIGFLFRRQNIFKEYIFNIVIYNKIAGILLLPVVAMLPFISGFLVIPLEIVGAFILIFTTLLKYIRGLKIIISKGILIFYLILYLCTFEIIPVLLMYKFFKSLI